MPSTTLPERPMVQCKHERFPDSDNDGDCLECWRDSGKIPARKGDTITIDCDDCNGSGTMAGYHTVGSDESLRCSHCEAEGTIEVTLIADPMPQQDEPYRTTSPPTPARWLIRWEDNDDET